MVCHSETQICFCALVVHSASLPAGLTMLHLAVQNSNKELVKMILDSGADINAVVSLPSYCFCVSDCHTVHFFVFIHVPLYLMVALSTPNLWASLLSSTTIYSENRQQNCADRGTGEIYVQLKRPLASPSVEDH